MKVELIGLKLPEIKTGDDLADLLVKAASRDAGGLKDGDIIVVTSKVVSKAYGFLVELKEIKPSAKAVDLARETGEDPRFIQAILDHSDRLLFVLPVLKLVEKGVIDLQKLSRKPTKALELIRKFPYTFFVERKGQVYSDAGLDASNHPEGVLSFPPEDPDGVARELRRKLFEYSGKDVAVVISDTEFMPFLGSLDIARGSSGIQATAKKFGEPDRYGKPKFGGADCIVHELACASALLIGQTDEGIPAVIVRGLKYVRSEEGVSTIRLTPENLETAIKEIVKTSIKILGLKTFTKLLLSV